MIWSHPTETTNKKWSCRVSGMYDVSCFVCCIWSMCSLHLLLRLCPRPYQWWRGWWGQWGKWGQCATATPAAAGTSALRANTWAAGPNGASCTASQGTKLGEQKICWAPWSDEEGELGTGGASTLYIRDLFKMKNLMVKSRKRDTVEGQAARAWRYPFERLLPWPWGAFFYTKGLRLSPSQKDPPWQLNAEVAAAVVRGNGGAVGMQLMVPRSATHGAIDSHWNEMGVSLNGGTPKSSILIGISILGAHHFWKHPNAPYLSNPSNLKLDETTLVNEQPKLWTSRHHIN